MPRLLMVGLSHHAAPIEVRERVAIDEAVWRGVAPPDIGTVLLSTCNRVEVYAWIDGRTRTSVRVLSRALADAAGVRLGEIQPYLTSRVGRDALLHLVRVASGLDSLVVGEEQIRGQVRSALRSAENCQRLPPSLRGIFQRVAESARRIRSGTRLGQVPSIAVAGVNVARRGLAGGLQGELAVVLGAGVMARAATEALVASGARVLVLNRTRAHAERLLAHLRGTIDIDSLEALPDALARAALVVGATASREPVIDRQTLERAARLRNAGSDRGPLVLLDIALPRDVDPAARQVPGIQLIDLEDLERLCPVDTSTRDADRRQAETLAVEEAERLAEWLRLRAVSPAIAALRTYAEDVRTSELRRSAARLRELTPEQVAAVDALTAGIVKKLMHGPTVALREAASRPGSASRSRSRILRLLRPPRDGRTSGGRTA